MGATRIVHGLCNFDQRTFTPVNSESQWAHKSIKDFRTQQVSMRNSRNETNVAPHIDERRERETGHRTPHIALYLDFYSIFCVLKMHSTSRKMSKSRLPFTGPTAMQHACITHCTLCGGKRRHGDRGLFRNTAADGSLISYKNSSACRVSKS